MTIARVDIHAHYGFWPYGPTDHGLSVLLDLVHGAQIDLCWLSSALAITVDMVRGNSDLFEAIEPHEELAGQVVINPHSVSGSIQEIKKYMEHPRFVGLKTHPHYCAEPCDSLRYHEIFQAYSDLSSKPILVHSFCLEEARCLIRLAKDFPQLRFIMAHMGGIEWKIAVDEACDQENIYFEPCCSFPFADKVAYAVRRAGPERFLLGTDLTLLDPWFSIGMIESAEIDSDTKQRIYSANALQLLDY
ncbi:MAG: amidohydrolase family protein [bacterium]